jgi:hypothetical protein
VRAITLLLLEIAPILTGRAPVAVAFDVRNPPGDVEEDPLFRGLDGAVQVVQNAHRRFLQKSNPVTTTIDSPTITARVINHVPISAKIDHMG